MAVATSEDFYISKSSTSNHSKECIIFTSISIASKLPGAMNGMTHGDVPYGGST